MGGRALGHPLDTAHRNTALTLPPLTPLPPLLLSPQGPSHFPHSITTNVIIIPCCLTVVLHTIHTPSPPYTLLYVFHITYIITIVQLPHFFLSHHITEHHHHHHVYHTSGGRGGTGGHHSPLLIHYTYITYTAPSDTRTQEADESILTTKLA